ncbi:MAG: AAA family ATPase [Planctomycetia bacterium]|nr:AAA family ATPase [Planctomycetia bacterium]
MTDRPDDTALASQPAPLPLARLLATDGPLEQALQQTRMGRHHTQRTELLHRNLTDLARRLRAVVLPATGTIPGAEPQAAPTDTEAWDQFALDFTMHPDHADQVLLYALAWWSGQDDRAARLLENAVERYCCHAADYDRVLGDFLPQNLRGWGHELVADHAFRHGSHASAAEDWAPFLRRLDERRQQPLLGLSTGLSGLDQALGGLRGLTLLAGGAGVGKTSLALHLALATLRQQPQLGILFYSLDMPRRVVYERLLCAQADVTYRELLATSWAADVHKRLGQAEQELFEHALPRLRVLERASLPPPEELNARVLLRHRQELEAVTPLNQVLWVVDYLQLLELPTDSATAVDLDQRRIGLLQAAQAASRLVAGGAEDVLLVLSEVRKGEPGRAELGLVDLMGSSRLGYSADAVLLLEADATRAATTDTAPLHLRIAKARDGMARQVIPLHFDYTRYRFREPGTRQPASPQPARHTAAASFRRSSRTARTPSAASSSLNLLAGGPPESV